MPRAIKTADRPNTKVVTSEWYTLQDIVRKQMFPWASSFSAIRNIVEQDKKKTNILKATITGVGRGKKYHFKGEHIINFIKQVEAGKISF